MIKDLLLYFALLLWFVVPSQAQPTIFAEDVNGDPQDTIQVDIKVENFVDVVGLQYTFEWDSTVLEFVDFQNFNLIDLGIGNFGPAEKVNFITSIWFESYLSPITKNDGEILFSMRFVVVGNEADTSKLWFSGSQLPNAASVNGQQTDVESKMAFFRVNEDPNATHVVPANFNLKVQPNPFSTNTNINFNLDKNYEDVQFSIYSVDGKMIHHSIYDFSAGNQSIRVDANWMDNLEGLYIYKITNNEINITDKLILNNY